MIQIEPDRFDRVFCWVSMMNAKSRDILKQLRKGRTVCGEALPGDFVRPNYDGYGLANIAPTVLNHFGVAHSGTPLAEEAIGTSLKGVRKLVVLLVDALGFHALNAQMKTDRSLVFHELARRGNYMPLTSVFPSTTAVCTSTLYTGLPPVGHAITGYRMYLKDRGVVGNMIGLTPEGDGRPAQLLREPDDVQRLLGVPTVHRQLKKKGVKSYCLIRNAIAGSGLSQMIFDGAQMIPVVTVADLMVQIRKLVQTEPDKPAVIWAYWGQVDAIQHAYGTRTEEMQAEVRNVAFSLKQELIKPLNGQVDRDRAALMLFADHGHVQVAREDCISLPKLRKVSDLSILPMTGTGRSGYFFARAGCKEDLLRYFKTKLGHRALVFSAEEALADTLWGTGRIRREMKDRIGDILVLPDGAGTLFYPYRASSKMNDLLGGRHGGLHEDEMLIPFFCTRF